MTEYAIRSDTATEWSELLANGSIVASRGITGMTSAFIASPYMTTCAPRQPTMIIESPKCQYCGGLQSEQGNPHKCACCGGAME